MKFIRLSFLILVSIAVAVSCDNELKINAPWKDITVLIGLLDPQEDTNWVRVERGYLGTAPASASFDEPDSLYYQNIEVALLEYRIDQFDNRAERTDSVVLIMDNTSRELNGNGPFTTEGYRIYRTPPGKLINEAREYEVKVIKLDGGPEASADTRIVEPFSIRIPPSPINSRVFNLRITWDKRDNIAIYQPFFHFYYKEFDRVTKDTTDEILTFQYPDVTSSQVAEVTMNKIDFFQLLAGRIPTDPNKLRFFQKIKIEVWGGGEDLYTYMNLNKPATGINQVRPEFPGVENGTGLLSSRTSAVRDDVGLVNVLLGDLITHEAACAMQFATVVGSDTCICLDLPGNTNTLECL